MLMILGILAIKYFLAYNIRRRREPSLSRVRKALLWSEFIFILVVCAAILILYASFYTSKRDNSLALWYLMLTLLVYYSVRYITIKKKVSTGILCVFLMCCLICWSVGYNILSYVFGGRGKKEYSSMQKMEQAIGEKFLLPSGVWDSYPADKDAPYSLAANYARIVPYPLLNYPVPNSRNIKGYILNKSVDYDETSRSRKSSDALMIVDVRPYKPSHGYHTIEAEKLSSQRDDHDNPYYCYFDGVQYLISFEYQGYVYTIDIYSNYGLAGGIAKNIYHDLRYGENW